jgi:adenylate kinase
VIILLFGPPGCGKGTQASQIAERFNIPAISTGEMFRAECKAGTDLGKNVCSILSSGGLVSDDLTNRVVASRLRKPDCGSGFLLDGYPRSVAQAVFLSDFLKREKMPEPVIVHLDVPVETLVSRLTSRRQCPSCSRIYNLLSLRPKVDGRCDVDGTELIQREDDNETTIRQRLKSYTDLTGPVLGYYQRRNYYRVDGNQPPSDIFRRISFLLEQAAESMATA